MWKAILTSWNNDWGIIICKKGWGSSIDDYSFVLFVFVSRFDNLIKDFMSWIIKKMRKIRLKRGDRNISYVLMLLIIAIIVVL